MSSKESFREKLHGEVKRREEERQTKLKREREEEYAALHRFQEEIKTKGKPFWDVLCQSKILDYPEVLKEARDDTSLEMYLRFGLEKLEDYQCCSVGVDENGEYDFSEHFGSGFSYKGTNERDMMSLFDLWKDKGFSVEVEKLGIFLSWNYHWDDPGDGGGQEHCDAIRPFEIKKRGTDFYITIGKSVLRPNDWKSPEKVQNVIIQEYLKADRPRF